MPTPKQEILAALREYRRDPGLFARKVLRLEPTAQQQEFLAALATPGAKVAVRSGHGTGKSTALAVAGLWFISTHRDALVPCTAPTAHQLEDVLWREYRALVGRMNGYWRDQFVVTADKITRKNSNCLIVARTARKDNPDALQGFHAANILFEIDEAAGVPDGIFEVARGALSTPSARVAMAANPTRLSGYFHRAFHLSRAVWTRLRFSCLDSPLVDPGYAADIAAEYGVDSDMYRVRVLGDFPKAGLWNLISQDLVDAAMNRSEAPAFDSHAPRIMGIDPAWLGSDRSGGVLRQGLSARILFRHRGLDTVRLTELVARKAEDENPDAIFVDQTGVGAGVFDQLLRTGLPVIGVSFSQSPLAADRFVNKRAEMWWSLREWLERGPVLQEDADLRTDLTAPEYFTTDCGKIQLESKEAMRKRGLASPDLGDALALTFAMPVQARHGGFVLQQSAADYSPYEWMTRRG
ncbi:MAG: hypothetical protein LIQ30_06925 [Planctomycetes bacterium]|nr:hypothetical protein [Planctomycetota bacterium]MCD7896953.1 hypothetical protein [Planctomycetaceae bacterium]